MHDQRFMVDHPLPVTMRTVYDAIVGGDLAAAKSAASKDSPALLGGSEEQKAEVRNATTMRILTRARNNAFCLFVD